MTLDDVVGERRVRGLKIDVEGAERLVLSGAERLLADQRVDLMQLEWNGEVRKNFGESRSDLASLIRDHGYELFRPDAKGSLHRLLDDSEGADVFARPRR